MDKASTSQSKYVEKSASTGNRQGLGHTETPRFQKTQSLFQPTYHQSRSISPKTPILHGKSLVSTSHRSQTPTKQHISHHNNTPIRFQTPNRQYNQTPRHQTSVRSHIHVRSHTSIRFTSNKSQTPSNTQSRVPQNSGQKIITPTHQKSSVTFQPTPQISKAP